MTTARDLFIVALDMESSRPVERGNLALALAGAEMADLLEARAVTLDGDRIVPGYRPTLADRVLDEAADALLREPPYETVGDWLWRRGRDLTATYAAALEAEGQLARERRHGFLSGAGQAVLVDSPARREAAERWTAGEPVLGLLAEAVGVRGNRTPDAPEVADDAVATVLAAVDEAVVELDSVRQRKAIEDAAFENIWRGPDQ
ncbi:GOLPH3/VPS74 family protein [Streptomyces sp. NPDC002004]